MSFDSKTFSRLAERLLTQPAAPYHEHLVRAEVERICAENRLSCDRDEFGNLLVRLQTAPGRRALVLAAHLDHPGFDILRSGTKNGFLARFNGGVPDEYFRPGVPIRLMPGGVPAKLGRRHGKERVFEIATRETRASESEFAVWDLESFAQRDGKIHARACDDLIGVAATLATMIELKKSGSRVHVIGMITRAEEVGFHGALAAATGGRLPKNGLIISLETSRELPGVTMGEGVIVRVGDRTSMFDSDATRFLWEVAAGMKESQPGFAFQRALMGGGTCEATAYQEYGFQTAALCVALGNYHNCGPKQKIAAEYVSLSDACGMADLLIEAARKMPDYQSLVSKLPARLKKLRAEALPKLRQTAG
jgi:endoglucanase